MLIILGSLLILTLAVGTLIYVKHKEERVFSYSIPFWLEFVSTSASILFGAVSTTVIVTCIATTLTNQRLVVTMPYEREVIVAKYEHAKENDNFVVQSEAYDDIIRYNRVVLSNRTFSKNLFVNWFYSKDIGKLELIEIDELERGRLK